MDKKTKEALEESIAHWSRLCATDDPEELRKEGYFGEQCALCDMFAVNECVGCPVSLFTGLIDCHGSPYIGAGTEIDAIIYGGEALHEHRLAELEFLKSLRQKCTI